MILTLSLTACATAMPDGGVATYDALKQAQDKCAAQGKTLQLKASGNSERLEDYVCRSN